ncbi:MAG: DUF1015 family protein [Oscillospiraceae bacterium]|jgi:uncharacterized protein (DUF1015 family)|nr:DUF1015 family protein [Oscillospiraceae bacterium]
MAVFRPFRAIRPAPALAAQVAALPYDTMSTAEARVQAATNPLSFLHIDKAEIDLPETMDPYADLVYETAARNLRERIRAGVFAQDAQARFYVYRQTWQGHSQLGLVGCAAIADYRDNIIKKHELTHPEKETDRIRHVTACDANTGPIFLTYRDTYGVAALLEQWRGARECEAAFTSGGVLQEIWSVADPVFCARLEQCFARTPALYIADGHHRCASAYHVGVAKQAACPDFTGREEFNYFLAVAFPENQLRILDYNRVVRDLNGLEPEAFLSRVDDLFSLEPQGAIGQPYVPEATHYFGLLLDGRWYRLRARRGSFDDNDPIARLDVEILQKNLLAPILGIQDPRRDHRIAFVGGIRGLAALEQRCQEDMRVAFAMFPTTTAELMEIADSGNIMPPKSTWFEPKLLSGLFIHALSD